MNFQPYDSDADWVITGVPFDMATSGRAGGRHGPAAIRQVSTNLAWEHNRFPWNFDMRERLNVVDCGDLVYAFGDAREMSEKLQAHAEKLLAAGKRMLSFGGDHFVTLPLLRWLMRSISAKWRWYTLMPTPIPTLTVVNLTTAPCSIPRRKKV